MSAVVHAHADAYPIAGDHTDIIVIRILCIDT